MAAMGRGHPSRRGGSEREKALQRAVTQAARRGEDRFDRPAGRVQPLKCSPPTHDDIGLSFDGVREEPLSRRRRAYNRSAAELKSSLGAPYASPPALDVRAGLSASDSAAMPPPRVLRLLRLLPLLALARASSPLYRDPDAPVDARVADLLARMTLEEKVAQLLEPFPGEFNSSALLARFGAAGVGAVYATGLNDGLLAADWYDAIFAFQTALVAGSRLGIPATIVSETLHSSGGSTHDNGTAFPGPTLLSSSFNASLVEAVGAAVGAEARAGGFLRGNAPVLQVVTDPRFGRFEEAFGEDPFLVARMGVAMILGQQGPSAGGPSGYLNDTSHVTTHLMSRARPSTPSPTRSRATTFTARTSASARSATCTCGPGGRPSARAACAASWSPTRRLTACRCTATGPSSRACCAARPSAARSSSWPATPATSRT